MNEEDFDPSYAQGWIEILHRKDGLPVPKKLMELTPNQYTQVGSNLPLCEYYSPVDVYQQFADKVDPDFGVPRSFRAYDAIVMCSEELNRIVTMILIPRANDYGGLLHFDAHVQQTTELPMAMCSRPETFESFYLRNA